MGWEEELGGCWRRWGSEHEKHHLQEEQWYLWKHKYINPLVYFFYYIALQNCQSIKDQMSSFLHHDFPTTPPSPLTGNAVLYRQPSRIAILTRLLLIRICKCWNVRKECGDTYKSARGRGPCRTFHLGGGGACRY